jgi:predicted short-subunit dehydrogenase-like oxidoreductase (DUF2520 family)
MTIANMVNKTKVSIVGAGNIGSALAFCFGNQNYSVELISRDKEQAINRFSKALVATGLKHPSSLVIRDYPASFEQTDLVLLCVPDSAIESTCESLAEKLCGKEIVAHCSGALDSSALDSAKQRGCLTASAHPFNTFPNLNNSLEVLADKHNSYLYCEGDEAALSMILTIFEQVGFTTTIIEAKSKILYHAACVFASNYLTLLMDMSLQTAKAANIDQREFLTACQPIIEATLRNLDTQSTKTALSGPLARGDVATVNQHIKALSTEAPELAKAYQVFADYAAAMLART